MKPLCSEPLEIVHAIAVESQLKMLFDTVKKRPPEGVAHFVEKPTTKEGFSAFKLDP